MRYEGYDFANPDVALVFNERSRFLRKIRDDPSRMPAIRVYYKENPADFINDWGMTLDPKGVERELPALIPFVIYPKQREWVEWVVDHWKNQKPELTDKSRQGVYLGFRWRCPARFAYFTPVCPLGSGRVREPIL